MAALVVDGQITVLDPIVGSVADRLLLGIAELIRRCLVRAKAVAGSGLPCRLSAVFIHHQADHLAPDETQTAGAPLALRVPAATSL